jgi:hypothetical protein
MGRKLKNDKADLMMQKAMSVAARLSSDEQRCVGKVFAEELIAAWGYRFFDDCRVEAETIRRVSWEMQKAEKPNTVEIDLEPPVELVLAVAIRKLLKVSLYNRDDFPGNIDEG